MSNHALDLADMPVQFLRGHPHAGEYGIPTGHSLAMGWRTMLEFALVGCEHGVERCFAGQGEAWLLSGGAKKSFRLRYGRTPHATGEAGA